jgi:hypothetical protein
MTRKHFRAAADIIKCISDPDERKRTAIRFATLFRQCNNRFDSDKFFRACELEKGG